jgi:hypothetical protein
MALELDRSSFICCMHFIVKRGSKAGLVVSVFII